MRKKTTICHLASGVVTAFFPFEWAVLTLLSFGGLEAWDSVRGHESWWDFQEFMCGFIVAAGIRLFVGGF